MGGDSMSRSGQLCVVFLLGFCFLLSFSPAVCFSYTLSFYKPPLNDTVEVIGTKYVLKSQQTGSLSVNFTVRCSHTIGETLPTSLSFTFNLLKNGIPLATEPVSIVPRWRTVDLLLSEYYVSYDFKLPATGTKTGFVTEEYIMEVLLQTGHTISAKSSSFPYTVFSRNLLFNQVLTSLSAITTNSACDMGDFLLTDTTTASWNSGHGTFAVNGAGLCTQSSPSGDGYSVDLSVTSGAVSNIGPVVSETAGLAWTIGYVTLDPAGGHFPAAAILLPDDVTYHLMINNQLWPRGVKSLVIPSSGVFADSINSITLAVAGQYFFHGYGLPFYVASNGFSLSLNSANSSGLVLTAPQPYYVHQTAYDSLWDNDPDKSYGFAGNDSMFREAGSDPYHDNAININGNGVNGHLEFNGNVCYTAFPKARMQHPSFGVDIVDNALDDGNVIDGNYPLSFVMGFDGSCPSGDCGQASPRKAFNLTSQNASFFSNGALAGRFANLEDTEDPATSELEWGGFNGTDGTFFRDDGDKQGVWVVPGFVMADTAATPTQEATGRIGQTLLASFTFHEPLNHDDPLQTDAIHLLNYPSDYAAYWGDGFFAGITMGPEILNGPYSAAPAVDEGVGALLDNGLGVRFNGNTDFASMPDRAATKYNLRPGGLTGVFNTGFSGAGSGDVAIYGYNINFSRFSFRQTLNRLSPETFIDGELTLPPPVGDADGMRIGFSRMALSCNGNLGSGNLDNEPEPDWPNGSQLTGCDGEQGDDDSYIDEGCHVLGYWNMPILLTGMTFDNDPDDSGATGECNSSPRVLKLNSRNLVNGLGAPLTMAAVYTPDGLLRNQQLFSDVDTWIDKPVEGTKPGFSFRLSQAYLNEVTDAAQLPTWPGFTVLAGHVDVPLFNDAKLKGHFVNQSTGSSTPGLYMMEDGADNDHDGILADFDGADNDPAVGSVDDFRNLLAETAPSAAPKPQFDYHWPREGVIDLVYRANYQPSTPNNMAQFAGIAKSSDLAGVLTIDSVPDYINPQRTKFSFGISANTAAFENLSIDVGAVTDGLNDFLYSQLGVDLSFDLESMISGLTNAEQYMHDITGGDVTVLLGEVVDSALQEGLNQGGMADYIREAANGLSQAHQAPYLLSSALVDPFEELKQSLQDLAVDPDLDFMALSVDLSVSSEVEQALAPFIMYENEALRALYEDYTGIPGDERFDEMLARAERLKSAVNKLLTRLDEVRQAKDSAQAFLTGNGEELATDINEVITLANQASELVHDLYEELTVGLGGYATATDSNALIAKLQEAKQGVRAVKEAIDAVHLGDIADALFIASVISGSPLDVSMLHSAEDTANNAVKQLESAISEAEANLTNLLTSLPLADILATLDGFLGDSGLIQQSLRGASYPDVPQDGGLIYSLETIRDTLPETINYMTSDLDYLANLLGKLAPTALKTPSFPSWESGVYTAQQELDAMVGGMFLDMQLAGDATTSRLFYEIYQLEEKNFATVLAAPDMRERILITPVQYLLENASFQQDLQSAMEGVVTLLPNPSEEDIRNMIRSAILNTDQVEAMNRIFFEQFGFVSDMVDDVSTQLVHQINYMIRETIASVNQGLEESLQDMTADVGSDWGVQSAGIDGYALVSQDEIERIHLEADFTFAGDPDPTSYNAALDIATWNSSNERSGCTVGGTGNVDVVLSTHDVTAAMLGMDVGLREALLGFTMQSEPVLPLGVFGRVYLQGELGFESMVLYDLGFESAFGLYELYFAATGAARFSDYSIPKAAFYLGTSCGENNVLERLDPEVGTFIGDINPMTGVYVRGAVEVPIWNNGCALTLGVGADIGAWYFTEPGSGTYGGLLGGSAYGELACLAALKGSVTMIGQKSGSEYAFAGNGWGAAGVGWCSPSKWKSVRDARKDDWCLTGESTFGATYNHGWDFDGPDVSCCH